jgi:alpha-methylacyl-CoA racemase
VAPVVSPRDAPGHPHNAARNTFIDVGGVTQPAPAPRFGRTACAPPSPPARPGADTNEVLVGLGFSAAEIASLRDNGAAI